MIPRAVSSAVLLDRDGTLVHNYHYCRDPEQVHLLPGVAPALRWLSTAGYALLVISNQSGVARGLLGEQDLAAVHTRLRALLAAEGITLAGIYYCPHGPGSAPGYAGACFCRKPEPGLFFRAAAEHGLALRRSWYVGDMLNDIEAGNRAGCRTVLLDLGTEPVPDSRRRTPTYVARNLPHAARLILAAAGLGSQPVEPLPLTTLDRPRLTQGPLLPGDPSPIPTTQWAIQAAQEGAQ